MPPEEPERLYPLICEIVVWLIVGTGVTIALVLAALPQLKKRGGGALPAVGMLQGRPFTFVHAVPVLALTGLLVLLDVLQVSGGGEAQVTPSLLIVGMIGNATMDILVITLCLWMVQRGPRAVFGTGLCTRKTAIGKGLLYGLAAIPVVWLIAGVVHAIGSAFDCDMPPQEIFAWLNDPSFSATARAALIGIVVVIAPITEELLFRGILLPVLMKGRSFAVAAVLSSFYFALVHLNGSSFVPLMCLSVMFSAGYAATGSILTPIVMHTVFNATVLLAFYASPVVP